MPQGNPPPPHPQHIAIIMDGNSRWSKKHGLPPGSWHEQGVETAKDILVHAIDRGIPYVTLYAFSLQNWRRSFAEVNEVFSRVVRFLETSLEFLVEHDIRFTWIGTQKRLPEAIVHALKGVSACTEKHQRLHALCAFNYGAQEEITDACNALLAKGVREITPELLGSKLQTHLLGVPDPDIILRTSGEKRLSNFLLWQASYAELIFRDTLWPDFSKEEFDGVIEEFQGRQRRFGGR